MNQCELHSITNQENKCVTEIIPVLLYLSALEPISCALFFFQCHCPQMQYMQQCDTFCVEYVD